MPKTTPRYLRRPAAAPAPPEERAVVGAESWLPAPALSGVEVTADAALSLTAYYAAINTIATDAACLPLQMFRSRPGGGQDRIRDDDRCELLESSPDGVSTPIRSRQALMGHVLGRGNGYYEVVRRGNGKAARLELMDPDRTRAERVGPAVLYKIDDGRDRLPTDRVIHVAGFGFDGLCGYSAARLMRQAIGLGLATEAFGSTFFGNNAHAGGHLKTPHKLSKEAIENLRQSIRDMHGGPYRAHGLAVFEQGLEWVKNSVDPDDAQFLATRQFQVVEVARWFRLPPHKIGDYTQSHLANIEASNIDYLTTALMPWLVQVEQELNRKLFSPAERAAGYYVAHNANALLRGDALSRHQVYEIGVRNGWRSRNEVKSLENENPIPADLGGDLYTIQAQVVPLDAAGVAFGAGPGDKPPASPAAPASEPSLDPSAPPEDKAPARAGDLDGNQLFSLKRIVNDVALGELPGDAAWQMIRAAFPSLDAAAIDAMVNASLDFTPASLRPKP